MKKHVWILVLLAQLSLLPLSVLLTGCVGLRRTNPVPRGAVVDQPQPMRDTPPVKVATLVPTEAWTPSVLPTATLAPTLSASAEEVDAAIANLRALLGDAELALQFKGIEPAPNAHNIPTLWLVDPLGNRYYVSQKTLRPVEFTQERLPHASNGAPMTDEALRALAEQLALQHSTRFADLRSQLTYTEAGKGENHFFRWELAGSDVGGMPAILQFGLREDGALFGYLNSMDGVEEGE